jgi:hypothetical protein
MKHAQETGKYCKLGAEVVRSQNCLCDACGGNGASVRCTHSSCRGTWHLPCAIAARNVLLERDSFEAWCPAHARSTPRQDFGGYTNTASRSQGGRFHSTDTHHQRSFDGGDEDYVEPGSSRRPRRAASLSRKHRFARAQAPRAVSQSAAEIAAAAMAVSDRVQRPRTDWQRHGDIWVKVVPPWWCDQRTIHFASESTRGWGVPVVVAFMMP